MIWAINSTWFSLSVKDYLDTSAFSIYNILLDYYFACKMKVILCNHMKIQSHINIKLLKSQKHSKRSADTEHGQNVKIEKYLPK